MTTKSTVAQLDALAREQASFDHLSEDNGTVCVVFRDSAEAQAFLRALAAHGVVGAVDPRSTTGDDDIEVTVVEVRGLE